jgi:CDGSH iron-sulfur domain-containing protein 3
MDKPVISQKEPIAVDLKKGQTYAWCACGRSENQPFCDGSHLGTTFEPLVFVADEDKKAFLCACKYTKKPPYCDGAHKDL